MNNPLRATSSAPRDYSAWKRRAYIVWTIIGACLVSAVLGYVLNVLAIPVGIVIWTVIFVFIMRGTVNSLNARGLSRMASVCIAYLIFVAVLVLIGFIMFSPLFGIGDQFTALVTDVPSYIATAQAAWNDFILAHPEVVQNQAVNDAIMSAAASVTAWVNDLAGSTVTGLFAAGTLIGNAGICIGFALVVAFWMLLSAPDMGREIRRLFGGTHEDDLQFFYLTTTRVIGGYIKGTLIQCGLIAVLCGVVFVVLGVPNAVAFAIITGILNIIPVIGPWLGGAAAAGAALVVSPFTALLALVLTIAVQQIIYTFVSPKIMSESVDVHPVVTILAMMAGMAIGSQLSGTVGGLTGMLLGIPAAALAKSMFVYYFERNTGRVIVAEDGVFFKGTPAQAEVANPGADATGSMPPVRTLIAADVDRTSPAYSHKKQRH